MTLTRILAIIAWVACTPSKLCKFELAEFSQFKFELAEFSQFKLELAELRGDSASSNSASSRFAVLVGFGLIGLC